MKLLRWSLLCLPVLVTATPTFAREWSDDSGKYHIEAELVEFKAGEVRLKRVDGKIITVPLARLSQADQAFLEESNKPAEKKAVAATTKRSAKALPTTPTQVDPELADKFMTQVFFKNADEVQEMLAAEPKLANCEYNYETPLIKACSSGSLELVKLLVAKGANVQLATSNGNTPLMDAVMRTNLEVVQFLIDQGADPVAPAGDGFTPLHRAATKEIAVLLLSLKADVAARADNEDTPLHSVIDMGFLEVAELLIDKGADLEAVGNWDRTPLHVACVTPFGDHQAMVEMLLKKGANFKALGFIDDTVVHECAFHGKLELVERFVAEGIDVNAKNQNGQTALDLATQSNRPEMIALLKKLGAK